VAESLHAPRARQELALFLLKEIKTPADYKEKSFADLLHALELLQFNGETLAENLKEASSALLCALSNFLLGHALFRDSRGGRLTLLSGLVCLAGDLRDRLTRQSF